jgi:hypothetical protein
MIKMYYSVKKVTPLPNYRLQLLFEGSIEKTFDCNPYLDTGRFKELKDIQLFNSVKVSSFKKLYNKPISLGEKGLKF